MFKQFPAKKGLWLADLSGLPIGGLFFGWKPLELVSWLKSQKKLTLGTYMILFFPFFILSYSRILNATLELNEHKFWNWEEW